MKYLKLFLCLLLAFSLAACGNDPATDGGNKPNTPDASNSTTNPTKPTPPPADTWFNAQGQYGTVEYTFNQHGMPDKTIFHYASGNVWRIIEHSTLEDNAYSSLLYCQSIYNTNGSLLFSLEHTMQTKHNADYEIPETARSYDHYFKTLACDLYYDYFGGVSTSLRRNDHCGAQDYAIITWKSGTEIEKITLYYREGVRKGTLFAFYEEGALAYLGICQDYDDAPFKFYKVEYADGRICRLVHGRGVVNGVSGQVTDFSESSEEEILLQYDAAGHITQIYRNGKGEHFQWDFFYEGDTLKSTDYRAGSKAFPVEELSLGQFILNSDGTLASADYSFLNGSLGGGDTSYYVYTYHPNGMIANIKCYWASPAVDESDELDLEREYTFAEDGSLIS